MLMVIREFNTAFEKAALINKRLAARVQGESFISLDDIVAAVKQVSHFSRISVNRQAFSKLELPDQLKEAGAMLSTTTSINEATNEEINQVLRSLDRDTISNNESDKPACYIALQNALFAGLAEYIERHPSPVLVRFYQSLVHHFNAFLNGEPVEQYSFSISVRSEFCMEYVDFNFEESVLEVSSGGSVYSPDVGSDSYTNWFYAIWDDGVYPEFFSIIYEILKSENSTITISEPDRFYYSVEDE